MASRQAFLTALTLATPVLPATASSLGTSTRVTNALPATLGPPGQLPFGIPRVPGGPRGPTGFNLITWRNFYNGLQNMVALPNHPLESYEGRTLIYFSHFADLVLNTINGRRRHQHFAVLDRLVIDIDQPHLPAIQQPQIHITGESGFVLTSNGEPFFIVELKRFIPPEPTLQQRTQTSPRVRRSIGPLESRWPPGTRYRHRSSTLAVLRGH